MVLYSFPKFIGAELLVAFALFAYLFRFKRASCSLNRRGQGAKNLSLINKTRCITISFEVAM